LWKEPQRIETHWFLWTEPEALPTPRGGRGERASQDYMAGLAVTGPADYLL
jgi:hypothetical protein